MRGKLWVLLALAALAGLVAGGVGSCAIDDEPTWITDPECSGCRGEPDLSSYECDTDSSCTPGDGCVDWDCPTADAANPDGGPPPRDAPTPDEAVDGPLSADGDDANVSGDSDDPPEVSECEPSGGGATRETAEELVPNVPREGLLACEFPSRWFQFSVNEGQRFAVVLQPAAGRAAQFLLYGEDGSLVASAEMDADASFAADAARTATYFLRVRGVEPEPVGYALVVQLLP